MSHYKLLKNKLVSLDVLLNQVNSLKNNNKKIVFTNGCFDILHVGHVTYLAQAADLGDFLIVAVNTDYSVKRLGKADNRPINNESARASIIGSLECVGAAILFNDDTPFELIKAIKPNVLVKGGDYKIEEIVGHDIVTQNGGKVITIPTVEGFSTTAIIKSILK
ncbi:MAG: D-glycero-beta-D-manno-heptose 1-phosphate adenylyltransferase [Bacteroidetes bacterium]|nr:D-glycero-beta-D-manno-heptose 1-phosphate adenylyltransferase [Bacteroidota bacterium]